MKKGFLVVLLIFVDALEKYTSKNFYWLRERFHSLTVVCVMNSKPGGYHFGFTDDLHHMIQILHKRYPKKSLYAAGFSLGGNVILKYLGEQGEKLKDCNFKGAAVTSVAFDPAASLSKLNVGFTRMVYSNVSEYWVMFDIVLV